MARTIVEIVDQRLSDEELVEWLFSPDELKYLVALEVWNKRHENPIKPCLTYDKPPL